MENNEKMRNKIKYILSNDYLLSSFKEFGIGTLLRLGDAGILTITDLLSKSEEYLASINNIGPDKAKTISDKINEAGFRFFTEEDYGVIAEYGGLQERTEEITQQLQDRLFKDVLDMHFLDLLIVDMKNKPTQRFMYGIWNHFRTLGELLMQTEDDIKKLPGVGEVSVSKLNELLKANDLRLLTPQEKQQMLNANQGLSSQRYL